MKMLFLGRTRIIWILIDSRPCLDEVDAEQAVSAIKREFEFSIIKPFKWINLEPNKCVPASVSQILPSGLEELANEYTKRLRQFF